MKFKAKIENVRVFAEADIPLSDWANYIAQDSNGGWWEYENKPSISCMIDAFVCDGGNYCFICSGSPSEDFTQELYKVYYIEE